MVDSFTATPEVNSARLGRCLISGPGADFPGIPLALLTRRHTVLLDSVAKKARVLGEYMRLTGLRQRPSPERAEELRAKTGVLRLRCYARAVTQLPSSVELASPLLAEWRGSDLPQGAAGGPEVERGDRAASDMWPSRVSDRGISHCPREARGASHRLRVGWQKRGRAYRGVIGSGTHRTL